MCPFRPSDGNRSCFWYLNTLKIDIEGRRSIFHGITTSCQEEDFNAYASLSYGMNMNTLSAVIEGFPDLEGNSLDFCPRIGFNYMLSEHFGLDFSAGITSILSFPEILSIRRK